jgi:glycosyltransferase involved in cell wall biosynthesis
MGLLFIMPRWGVFSEVWMRRMLDALTEDMSYLAVEHPPEKLWKQRVPIIDLVASESLFNRLRRRLGFRYMPRGKRLLTRAVHSEQVTSIFIHWLNFALQYTDLWNETNKPLFVHCHGYDVTWNLRSHDLQPRHSPEYPSEVRRLAQRAILIANSRSTARKLRDIGVPADRIVLHYFGIPSVETPLERPARTSNLTVLYLGRLIDFKGPDLVIQAFELACDRGFQGRLIMAGDGPLRPMCELLRIRSKYSDRIELLGAVDSTRAAKLLQEADIFTAHSSTGLLSNQEEGFGVAFAEAMGACLPVVTGRSGSLEELVEDGVTGRLISPGDVDAHADALLQLALNPALRLQMGKAAWLRAKTLFPPENDTVKLRQVLGLLPNR